MNWTTCRRPLPRACIALTEEIQKFQEVRMTEVFRLNTFVNADLTRVEKPNPPDKNKKGAEAKEEKKPEPQFTRVRCKVVVTRMGDPGDQDRERYQMSIFNDPSEPDQNETVHMVIMLRSDYFMSRKEIRITEEMGAPYEFVLRVVKEEKLHDERAENAVNGEEGGDVEGEEEAG